MDIKLSISALISSSFFLTLFLFKTLNNPGAILENLITSGVHGFGLFTIIYILAYYISFTLNSSNEIDVEDATKKIQDIETSQVKNDDSQAESEAENINTDTITLAPDSQKEIKNNSDTIEQSLLTKHSSQKDELAKLKEDSGTQFDAAFKQNNNNINI